MPSTFQLLFFPTAACHSSDGSWKIPIHGWIYRPTELSHLRRAGLHIARRWVQLRHRASPESLTLFNSRFGSFLADNERNQRITIQVAGHEFKLKKSRPNGHIRDTISLPSRRDIPEGWLTFHAVHPTAHSAEGKFLLLPSRGLSIISDIDDTLKISNVLQKRELLKNTFARPFACVPGMPALYQRWQRDLRASFHYVSASPWHLFPFLHKFLDAQKFPEGTWHLRDFRLLGRDMPKTFRSSRRLKIKHIIDLLTCYPERHFILVGDSGEHDPEIYARLARNHPTQIRAIYIRNITDENEQSPRWKKVFADLDPRLWQVFTTASELRLNASNARRSPQ